MIAKPDSAALHALDRFQASPEWQSFIRHQLQVELEATRDLLTSATDDRTIARAQGKARFITDFIAQVDNAGAHLERMRSQPQQNRQA